MALYCDNCIGAICNHCLHFKADDLDEESEASEDANEDIEDGDGLCLLYQIRVPFDNACLDFLCNAAARTGVGYREQTYGKSTLPVPQRFVAEAGQHPVFPPHAE